MTSCHTAANMPTRLFLYIAEENNPRTLILLS